MPNSRLRWRALAVLGALLSVVFEWPIGGLAMPANNLTSFYNENESITTVPTMWQSTSIEASTIKTAFKIGKNYNTTALNNIYNNNNNSIDLNNDINNKSHNSFPYTNQQNRNIYNYNNSNSNNRSSSSNLYKNFSDNNSQQRKITANTTFRVEQSSANYTKPNRKKDKVYNRLTSDKIQNLRTYSHLMQNYQRNNSEMVVAVQNRPPLLEDTTKTTEITTTTSETVTRNMLLDDESSTHFMNSEDMIGTTNIMQILSRTDRSVHSTTINGTSNSRKQRNRQRTKSNLDRNERSTMANKSGQGTMIRLYIKNRLVQILPDGEVNAVENFESDYTILQRTTVEVGQIKIQGAATCLYLCMDACGSVYSSKTFNDDCVFNEIMEKNYYNTYSSTFNSNSRRTLYLAFNHRGETRTVRISASRSLGKLMVYAKALPQSVPQERVERLITRTFGENRIKHGLRQLCDAGKPLVELTASIMKEHPQCDPNAPHPMALASPTNTSGNSSNSGSNNPAKLRLNNNSNNSSSSIHSNSNTTTNLNHPKKKKSRRRKTTPHEEEVDEDNNNSHGQSVPTSPENITSLHRQPAHSNGSQRKNQKSSKNQQRKQKLEELRSESESNSSEGLQDRVGDMEQRSIENQPKKPKISAVGAGKKNDITSKPHGGQNARKRKPGEQKQPQTGNNGNSRRSKNGGGKRKSNGGGRTAPVRMLSTTEFNSDDIVATNPEQLRSTTETVDEDENDDELLGEVRSFVGGGGNTQLLDDYDMSDYFNVFKLRLWRLVMLMWIAVWYLRIGENI